MKTILLIEDNAFIRENTAELLELAGYAVRTAENGQLGVELALAAPPDLVVCDIMMPVLDGYGVLRRFNETPALGGIPFIFLTAKTERLDRRQGMELGADDYLTKPFDSDELLSAVAGRLRRFEHLKPDYNLHADGLHLFLQDAAQAGNFTGLAADRQPRPVPGQQRVYAAGDAATRLYFVHTGQVQTSQTSAAGEELITGRYQAGDFFGYRALLAGTAHPDTATATEDTLLLSVPAADFTQLLLRDPAVSRRFVRLLVGSAPAPPAPPTNDAGLALRRPLADILLHLHEQQRGLTPTDALIRLSPDDLAALLGTSPETLGRALRELRQDGLVQATNDFVRVQQPERLRMRSEGW